MDSRRLVTGATRGLAAALLVLVVLLAMPSLAIAGGTDSPWAIGELSAASPITKSAQVKTSATLRTETFEYDGGDHTRCQHAVFIQVAPVPKATGYHVVYFDKLYGKEDTRSGQAPFPRTIDVWEVPSGAIWLAPLTGGHGPAPCPSGVEERFTIVSAVATVEHKKTYRISGKLTRKGKPAKNVPVEVFSPSGGGSDTTDKKGRYAVADLPEGSYTVRPQLPAKNFATPETRRVKLSKDTDGVNFKITGPVTLRGRVTTWRCIRDISYAHDPYHCGDEFAFAALAPAIAVVEAGDQRESTDENGRYKIEVPPGRKVTLRVVEQTDGVDPPHLPGRTEPKSRTVVPDDDMTGLDFHICDLPPEWQQRAEVPKSCKLVSISGTVRDFEGAPIDIGGVHSGPSYAATDKAGRFRLLVPKGTHIVAHSHDYGPGTRIVANRDVTGVRLELTPGIIAVPSADRTRISVFGRGLLMRKDARFKFTIQGEESAAGPCQFAGMTAAARPDGATLNHADFSPTKFSTFCPGTWRIALYYRNKLIARKAIELP